MPEKDRDRASTSEDHLRLSRFSSVMSQHYRHFLAKRLPELGLSLADYSIVLYLWHHLSTLPDGTSQTRLSESTLCDKAAVARGTRKLADLGYVSVKPDPANSSRNIVSLTDAGKDAGERIDAWVFEWEEHAMACLAEQEREAFLRTFERLFLDLRSQSAERA